MFAQRIKTLLAPTLALLLIGCGAAAQSSAQTPPTLLEAAAENSAPHDLAEDYLWDEAAVTEVALGGDSARAEGGGVTVDGNTVTVTRAGTYRFSGTLTDGQIRVDTADEEVVRLILDGVTVSHSAGAAINIVSAEKTVLILAEGSVNRVSDGEEYSFEEGEDEPNATIFSKGDLSISGGGSLTVEANYNDGVASKDGLVIAGGTLTVDAVDDAVRGKDYLVVREGSLTLTAGGDGLTSDNEEDAQQGYVLLEGGSYTLTAGGDAVQAETDLLISGGDFILSSGGGSGATLGEDASAKGLEADTVIVDGGTFAVDSADDAVHADTAILINDGGFTLASGDDAVHADGTLTVNGGELDITSSVEGLESGVIALNGGVIHIVSSDDGINISGEDGGSDGPRMGGRPGAGARPGGASTPYTGEYYLYINGGTIVVNASGDGLDANGAIEMTGGLVIVNGPTARNNGAIDYDATFTISGGTLIAAGSAGMVQAPSETSAQASLLLGLDETLAAGTLVHLQTADGADLLTFAPGKDYGSLVFSSPDLVAGETYRVYLGGGSSAAATDGLYEGGYSPGSEYASFTLSSSVTALGNVGGRGRF